MPSMAAHTWQNSKVPSDPRTGRAGLGMLSWEVHREPLHTLLVIGIGYGLV